MRRMGLQLDDTALSVASDTSRQESLDTSPDLRRGDQLSIVGAVRAVLFDFDGTLTATPGDRADRRTKVRELGDRAPMLAPWLERLQEAGIAMGVVSKSSEQTVVDALEAAGLRRFFDGPVRGKALSLDGKAGIIETMCGSGALAHLGAAGLQRVLLVDDDIAELARARELGISTFPAPEEGGLLDDDFREIFEALGLEAPATPHADVAAIAEIQRLWSRGLAGQSFELSTEQTQVAYDRGSGPLFDDLYDVDMHADVLGQGAFGKVRRGVHRASGAACAIKFIRKEVAGRRYLKAFVERDLNSLLLRMSYQNPHPNVCRLLDVLMASRVIYGAQELLEGPDLQRCLQQQQQQPALGEALVKRLMRQVFLALSHIHYASEAGIMHRDVKLENLRFRKSPLTSDLVLVDFCSCCLRAPARRRAVVGTLPYIAPEMFSHFYDEGVDAWCAGIAFYILLAGRAPWAQNPAHASSSRTACAEQAVRQALADDAVHGASPEAAALLAGLLAAAPGSRTSAAAALTHAWLQVPGEQPSSEVGASTIAGLPGQVDDEPAPPAPQARCPPPPPPGPGPDDASDEDDAEAAVPQLLLRPARLRSRFRRSDSGETAGPKAEAAARDASLDDAGSMPPTPPTLSTPGSRRPSLRSPMASAAAAVAAAAAASPLWRRMPMLGGGRGHDGEWRQSRQSSKSSSGAGEPPRTGTPTKLPNLKGPMCGSRISASAAAPVEAELKRDIAEPPQRRRRVLPSPLGGPTISG